MFNLFSKQKRNLVIGGALISAIAVFGVACGGGGDAAILATNQLNPAEEQQVLRTVLEEGGFELNSFGDEAAFLTQANAGTGQLHVVGSTYGTLDSVDDVRDVSDLLDTLDGDRTFSQALVDAGAEGSRQNYIPWLQAVYTFAAHRDALQHLPSGADINNLNYDQFIEWGRNLNTATGQNQIGFPAGDGGLMHRFIHGYIYPAYTGSVVTEFRSADAVAMWEKFRELWTVVSPASTTYSHMQVPLMAGEVMVAFDHTARLGAAFKDGGDENFIIFPAPSGPEGRYILPVPVGLAIPDDTPDVNASEELIDHLTDPAIQARLFDVSGWIPAVSGGGSASGAAAVIAEGVSRQGAVSDPGVFPNGVDGGAFSAVYRDAFTQIVLMNAADIQSVLDTQADVLRQLFVDGNADCWAPDTTPASGVCPVN